MWPQLLEHEGAMMRSQSGPLASTPLSVFLWTGRQGLTQDLSERSCFEGFICPFPVCSQLWVWPSTRRPCHPVQLAQQRVLLGRRGWALESDAARVCKEGGARVRANVFVHDMDLAEHSRLDCKRLEVVADGLPLLGGVQLAIDTTMVSHSTVTGGPGERPLSRTAKL